MYSVQYLLYNGLYRMYSVVYLLGAVCPDG